MSLASNKAIARRGWEEIWNKGDLTLWDFLGLMQQLGAIPPPK